MRVGRGVIPSDLTFNAPAGRKSDGLSEKVKEKKKEAKKKKGKEKEERKKKEEKEKEEKHKKRNINNKKMNLIKEYQNLSEVKNISKKTAAMNLMELIEEVKEKFSDGVYLKMMDQLMALNKEAETLQPHREQAGWRSLQWQDIYERTAAWEGARHEALVASNILLNFR